MDKSKKSAWVKWGAVAACLCLIVGGVILANNCPQVQQGDAGIGIDGTVPGGTLPEGVDPVMASIAVYPPAEKSLEDVADATLRQLSEEEAFGFENLGEYLPDYMPDGYRFRNGALYETTMKDGTKYYLLRVDYTTGDESAADYSVWLMTYEPNAEKQIYTLDTLPRDLPNDGVFHVNLGSVYVGIGSGELTYDEVKLIIQSINN